MQNQRPPQAQAAHSQSDDLANVMNANTQAALGSDVASVLKNTYMLLGLTLAFSALIAYLSMDMPRPGFLLS